MKSYSFAYNHTDISRRKCDVISSTIDGSGAKRIVQRKFIAFIFLEEIFYMLLNVDFSHIINL